MTAREVGADTVVTTSVGVTTLVDIHTSSCNVAGVVGPAWFTFTEGLLVLGFTECMLGTLYSLARLRAGHRRRIAHE